MRGVMESGSAEEIKEAYNHLQQEQIRIFSDLHKSASSSDNAEKKDDSTVDAEFEDKDGKKEKKD